MMESSEYSRKLNSDIQLLPKISIEQIKTEEFLLVQNKNVPQKIFSI